MIYPFSTIFAISCVAIYEANCYCNRLASLENEASKSFRSVVIYIDNDTPCTLHLSDENLVHGRWTRRPESKIASRACVPFAVQSSFLMGIEGSLRYKCRKQAATFKASWFNPFVGGSRYAFTSNVFAVTKSEKGGDDAIIKKSTRLRKKPKLGLKRVQRLDYVIYLGIAQFFVSILLLLWCSLILTWKVSDSFTTCFATICSAYHVISAIFAVYVGRDARKYRLCTPFCIGAEIVGAITVCFLIITDYNYWVYYDKFCHSCWTDNATSDVCESITCKYVHPKHFVIAIIGIVLGAIDLLITFVITGNVWAYLLREPRRRIERVPIQVMNVSPKFPLIFFVVPAKNKNTCPLGE